MPSRKTGFISRLQFIDVGAGVQRLILFFLPMIDFTIHLGGRKVYSVPCWHHRSTNHRAGQASDCCHLNLLRFTRRRDSEMSKTVELHALRMKYACNRWLSSPYALRTNKCVLCVKRSKDVCSVQAFIIFISGAPLINIQQLVTSSSSCHLGYRDI